MEKYEIEYSADGRNFLSFASKAATAGNSVGTTYAQMHTQASLADNFYRIKAISISGQVQYSAVVKVASVKNSNNPTISVYPNPVVDKNMNVQFLNQTNGAYAVQLISQNGAAVYQNKVTINGNNQVKMMKLQSNTAAGNYQLVIVSADGLRTGCLAA